MQIDLAVPEVPSYNSLCMKAKKALALGVPVDGKPIAAKVAVAYVVHADHYFLAESIRSFAAAGVVAVHFHCYPASRRRGGYQA